MNKLFSSLKNLVKKPVPKDDINIELIPYQGHWVDVNSDTTLDLSGSTVTVTSFGRKEQYPVTITINEYETVIDSKEGGFGLMSALRDNRAGTLIGYDMVLDARGHTYHFVREEQKALELEIKDLSKDAPKTINSNEIINFTLSFDKDRKRNYDLDDSWPNAMYRLNLEVQDDGKYEMSYFETFDSYMGANGKQIVKKQVALELAKLIEDQHLAQHNGYYLMNKSSAPGYSLYVVYQSKERLSITAQGDAADSSVFAFEPFLKFFKEKLNLS